MDIAIGIVLSVLFGKGSSLTVTWKPFFIAEAPFAMTASNPAP